MFFSYVYARDACLLPNIYRRHTLRRRHDVVRDVPRVLVGALDSRLAGLGVAHQLAVDLSGRIERLL